MPPFLHHNKINTNLNLFLWHNFNEYYLLFKEIDSVLGGKAAWENVDSIDVVCSSCNHGRAYFLQVQTRSADEPMTVFYKCCNCGNRWRE